MEAGQEREGGAIDDTKVTKEPQQLEADTCRWWRAE